jgi:hypothetical protein
MKKVFRNIGLTFGLLSMMIACSDNIDPVITELDTDRAFAPVDLIARVRNMTMLELSWLVKEDVKEYVVEFSEDSLDFSNIIRTVTVLPDEMPLQENFEGETRYSARVKAIMDGKQDSKWAEVTIMTAIENIFHTLEGEDIAATTVTLKWPAGSEVTHFIVNPGNMQRDITSDEIEAGEATIVGLTGETLYEVTLYNDAKRRGVVSFETLVDIGTATAVYPEDDLLAIFAAASEGDVLALFPGEYGTLAEGLTIAVDKSITIRGVYPFDKPVIYGQFTCGATVATLELRSLVVIGDGGFSQFVNTQSGCNLTTLSIIDCDISGYSNNFIYNNASGAYGSITVTDSYVHNIPGGGGDGIDFRGGSLGSLTVTNTTFANGFRTFLRMQVECASSFENCTFYKVASNDNGNNHGLFRSSGGGTFEVRNCLFVETGVEGFDDPSNGRGNFCRQASNMVDTPEYANNNIFGCYNIFGGLYNSAAEVSATEINPEFVDAENGDFTVTNQTIIDNAIGDPRWRP